MTVFSSEFEVTSDQIGTPCLCVNKIEQNLEFINAKTKAMQVAQSYRGRFEVRTSGISRALLETNPTIDEAVCKVITTIGCEGAHIYSKRVFKNRNESTSIAAIGAIFLALVAIVVFT